jgi:serine/threonine protein kinase
LTKVKFKNYENRIDEIFGKSGISDNGIDFLKKMLELNPQRRITADDALKHIWFKEDNEDLNKLEMEEINKNSDLYSK